jgi:predicted RNase H-like HicB family nuclease
MTLPIQLEQEDDGRWFGFVDELPGVMAYGASRDEAAAATRSLALRVLADRIDHGEAIPAALEQFMAVVA